MSFRGGQTRGREGRSCWITMQALCHPLILPQLHSLRGAGTQSPQSARKATVNQQWSHGRAMNTDKSAQQQFMQIHADNASDRGQFDQGSAPGTGTSALSGSWVVSDIQACRPPSSHTEPGPLLCPPQVQRAPGADRAPWGIKVLRPEDPVSPTPSPFRSNESLCPHAPLVHPPALP